MHIHIIDTLADPARSINDTPKVAAEYISSILTTISLHLMLCVVYLDGSMMERKVGRVLTSFIVVLVDTVT